MQSRGAQKKGQRGGEDAVLNKAFPPCIHQVSHSFGVGGELDCSGRAESRSAAASTLATPRRWEAARVNCLAVR